ncbi:hypothetical protein HYDPIDRAFT_97692 [Hydnomerulius pinastri MD-312]|uniref:Coenzyme Q-binding protein COQ10 START domain-containing protein n=1 Tax=Hydnomerulius pinastri MD-312 TaxID=994086 RepID=A0A0C9WB52_9AGAM|nr:hypothetical protein HYDPIDRAFT_97692 [Hydnomerulius pinastri MD-312]
MASTNTSPSTGLPPLASNGVFHASASIVIDAPRELVWEVLMDWRSYHEWNPFVRNQQLTDASKKPLPAHQQTPRAGAHLYIHPVNIPPSFDAPKIFPAGSAFEVITVLDTENYRCAWKNIDYPDWALGAERWQALVEVEEDGRKKTRYETIEVFSGILAHLVKIFVGTGLQAGFLAMAEGLKKRSEEKIRS